MDLMHKQVITALTAWRQPFYNVFWYGNQDGGDVTSCCVLEIKSKAESRIKAHIHLKVSDSNSIIEETEVVKDRKKCLHDVWV